MWTAGAMVVFGLSSQHQEEARIPCCRSATLATLATVGTVGTVGTDPEADPGAVPFARGLAGIRCCVGMCMVRVCVCVCRVVDVRVWVQMCGEGRCERVVGEDGRMWVTRAVTSLTLYVHPSIHA